MAEIAEERATVNGVEYVYLEAGTGPLALCLHGFPDVADGWRPLLGALAEAGYHAVAPYQRGYAPTAVPDDGLSPIGAWVADSLGFHDLLGGDGDAVIIGHDWGALTTYGAAGFAPERWRRVVTLSIPPTAIMGTRLFDYDQIRAFWYQYVFLQPTAEMIVSHDDLLFIERLWRDWSPSFDPTDVIGPVKDALRDPANLTAALSTYRTMLDMSKQPPQYAGELMALLAGNPQPTLYLHGTEDGCVPDIEGPEVLAVLPEGSQVEVIEGAGHFLQYEEPELVNDLVVRFVTT